MVNLDTLAPVITAPAPAESALLATARPALTASFADEPQGSGLDPAGSSPAAGRQDITAQAQVAAAGISYLTSANLPEGGHTAS